MAVPIPIDFVDLTVSAAPQGWGGFLPDFFNLLGQSISGQLDSTFLTGQVGGGMPAHDVGPWFNTTTNAWYWFDPATGMYQPGDQGSAVGTVTLWGGGYNLPPGWLVCDGRAVSRFTYSRLFQAVGETWGPGDGQTTFNLPPGAVFFFNAAGFSAQPEVSLNPVPTVPGQPPATASPTGVAVLGGSQLNRPLLGSDLPGLTVQMRIRVAPYAGAQEPKLPGTNIPNIQPPGAGTISFFTLPLQDMEGHVLDSAQQFSIMPPYCSMIYMIKYQ